MFKDISYQRRKIFFLLGVKHYSFVFLDGLCISHLHVVNQLIPFEIYLIPTYLYDTLYSIEAEIFGLLIITWIKIFLKS